MASRLLDDFCFHQKWRGIRRRRKEIEVIPVVYWGGYGEEEKRNEISLAPPPQTARTCASRALASSFV